MNNYTDEDLELEDELYKSRKLREQMELEFDDEVEDPNPKKVKQRKVNTNTNKSKKFSVKKIFTYLFLLGTVGIMAVLFLLYGPFSFFRDWLVTTAMTTMTHQYFATWFYDDETIEYVLNRNKIIEVGEDTDLNAIVIGGSANKTTYENEYERQIFEKDPNNNDYKIIEINEKNFDGYLAVVYDPSRVETVVTQKLGTSGQYLTKMAANNDALIAINGGGFNDPNFNSTGGSPLGITVSKGEYVKYESYGGSGGIIGFTDDNKLYLGKCSVQEAKSMGIRDAVTFGPFLIVNGKSSAVLGNGGWGSAPRTAIGQRKDGIVLFLVIDGRKATKFGADMDDMIRIMENYGAYNAANLDGGTSSVLVVDDVIVNDPIDSTGAHKTRPIATGFILKADDSDNGDKSVVQDKLNK